MGRCRGSRSIDGEVKTTVAKRILVLRSESDFSTNWRVLDGRVVLEVMVAIGM